MDITTAGPLIFSLIGIIIGAFLQGVFNRKNEKLRYLSDLQNNAYADFIDAVSNIAVAQRSGERDQVLEELAKLSNAKSRICVYGSSEVIKQMNQFVKAGCTLQTEQELQAFTELCKEMRKSIGLPNDIFNSVDLPDLLFRVSVADTHTPLSSLFKVK